MIAVSFFAKTFLEIAAKIGFGNTNLLSYEEFEIRKPGVPDGKAKLKVENKQFASIALQGGHITITHFLGGGMSPETMIMAKSEFEKTISGRGYTVELV